MQSNFLWGGFELKKKVHLVNWEKVSTTKDKGGLGIRKIRPLNESLFIKWWWRFSSDNKALWRRIICEKYGLNENDWLPVMRDI